MFDRERLRALGETVLALLSRLLVSPLAWLLPRDRRRVVVIGREGGKFLDNAKYVFCWLEQNRPEGGRPVFLSEHATVRAQLAAAGARAVAWPGVAGAWTLLRAGTVVFDSAEAVEHGRLGFLAGARLVQVWHGAPLKEIELPLFRRRLAALPPLQRRALALYKALTGRFLRYHVLVSTSAFFTERAFATCFHARRIVACGYPRNDMLAPAPDYPAALVALNTDQAALGQLREARAAGVKTLLYAPTFRQDKHSPFSAGWIDLPALSRLATEKGWLVALKLHPVLQTSGLTADLPGLLDIAPTSDAYPLLAEIDVLVTDYSSIYFDFLLLDRPIVFYPYDFASYTADDRRLLFDYETMTPGPRAQDFLQLCALLAQATTGDAPQWRAARARVRGLTFDHAAGGAAARLWNALGESDQ